MLENNHRIYLDNAATTPLDQEVIEAMLPVMTEHFGNPSSSHAHGRKVKSTIEECRSKIASLLHCKPSEIFFTSGGTEADNIALRCSIESLGVKHLITSSIEHHAVLHTSEELYESGKVELHLVNILPNGHIDLKHLSELLTQFPGALVSLMHANNEIGNLLDVNAVGTLVRNANGYFHCDTVQTMGHFPFNLEESKIDFLCAAAHKFNGPKGVGFLYINKRVRIKPLITGGAQEREMRGGTENVYGIVGLTKALEISYRDIEKKKTHITNLKSEMIRLLQQEIPGIEFNGDYNGECLYTVLSTSFPPNNAGNMLLFNLDIAGISASGGSACSSGAVGGSHVINAIKPNSDRTTVRFSFGKYNTLEDIQKTVETLKNWYA